jgi:hypothetical protein
VHGVTLARAPRPAQPTSPCGGTMAR